MALSEIDTDRIATARPAAAAVFCYLGGQMAGRGRKAGSRHKCGKLVQQPDPNPESYEKRRILVGGFDEPGETGRKVDPRDLRAGYPLGILFLRGQITEIEYTAALKFAGHHAVAFGRGAVKSHLETIIYGLRGIDYDEVDDAEREARKRRQGDQLGIAVAELLKLPTRRPYSVLMRIAVYEHQMRFMDTGRARAASAWAADQRDLDALKEAAGCLVKLWKLDRRGK